MSTQPSTAKPGNTEQQREREQQQRRMIFISLPVQDLKASTAFYRALGFEPNPQFSDETGTAMIWSEAIHVMLLTHAKWRSFTERPFPPAGTASVMHNLSLGSRDEVDAMNTAALAHGGQADVNPVQDLGFMYARDLSDPDGHLWGAFWMDTAAMPGAESAQQGG